jgi:hypothetical protein
MDGEYLRPVRSRRAAIDRAAVRTRLAHPNQAALCAGLYRLSYKAGWRGQWFVFGRPSYDPPMATSEAAIDANRRKATMAALAAFGRQAAA